MRKILTLAFTLGLGAWVPMASAQYGMTWSKLSHDSNYSVDHVGCDGCNPYSGDTDCSTPMPILCVKEDGSQNPGVYADFYNGWIGGHLGLTEAIAGSSIADLADADSRCEARFGPGYHMAEFHHSWGGWSWQAFGNIGVTGGFNPRFWVYINDQPANCF